MQLRILFLILGIAWKSWAQCPTTKGTKETGKLEVRVGSQNASPTSIIGTSKSVLKICKGENVYASDVTTGGGNTGFWYEYKDATIDFTSNLKPETNTSTHQYDKAGLYGLIMVGAAGSGYYACQPIHVVDNPEPLFSASSCKQGEVTVIILKDASRNPYDNFVIDWKDGNVSTVTQENILKPVSHNYSASFGSEASITVTGSYTGSTCKNSSTLKVKISTTVVAPPAITQLDLNANRDLVNLQIVANPSILQEVYMREVGGIYNNTGIQAPNGVNSLRVNRLDPAKQYCFQVRAVTGCINEAASNEVCTILLRLTPTSNKIDQNWTIYPNATDFESYTLSGGTKPDQIFKDINKVEETDADVVCGKEYCYRVTVTLKNGVKTTSNELCDDIDSNDKPESISDGYATVSGQGTLVDWKIPGGGQSLTDRIRKAEANGAFQNIPTSEVKKPFADAAVEVNRLSYCYQVAYQSTCRTNSDFSASFCTIYASQQGDRIQWTSASPFLDKLTGYRVQVVDAQGNVIQSQNVGLQTSVSVNSLGPVQSGYQYRIEALSENGNVSISNVISVVESVRIYVPQAFTPNGDTQNEVFLPTMLNVTQMKLVIFDRWGNPIFASEDMNRGWDGNVNGRPAPVGSYSYRVDIRNDAGNSFTKRGTFQLIR